MNTNPFPHRPLPRPIQTPLPSPAPAPTPLPTWHTEKAGLVGLYKNSLFSSFGLITRIAATFYGQGEAVLQPPLPAAYLARSSLGRAEEIRKIRRSFEAQTFHKGGI